MTLKTRIPTGVAPWPLVLLAGMEKAGKTYAAAAASASDMIDRTLWVGIGEDDPDEYANLPGSRVEIVEHDGTHRDILRALADVAALPVTGKPHLLVVDSASMYWEMLSEEAQEAANRRRKTDAADITPDLWNKARKRWMALVNASKAHPGPVLFTARMEMVMVMEDGKPTKEREWKVKGHKSLPYDVDVVVQMRARGDVWLTGVRSLRFTAPDPTKPTAYPDFTVADLWQRLGVGSAGVRAQSPVDGARSLGAEEPDLQVVRNTHTPNMRAALNASIDKAADQADIRPASMADMIAAADRDWHAEADKATDRAMLRLLWDEANHAGNREACKYISARAATLSLDTDADA